MRKNITRNGFVKCINDLFSICSVGGVMQASICISLGLFCLDYYDVPSRVVNMLPHELSAVLVVLLVLLSVIWICETHFFSLFKIMSVNIIDILSEITIFSVLPYSIPRMYILGESIYVVVAMLSAMLAGIILSVRFIIRWTRISRTNSEQGNLTDLKAIYSNDFTRVDGQPIFVLEEDVDYDLLDRQSISNQLFRSITHCQPKNSYVISLEGAWGVGKTTIINCVKRELNDSEYIVVDDFDPWLYGTQESLLLAMYESIINHTGLKYSPIKSAKLCKELSKIIVDSHTTAKILYSIFNGINQNGDTVNKLKNQLSSYLTINDKTIVFIIDNLDRVNDENIVFLFKLISIVFDLPGIVYVLSFEKERVSSILEKTHEIDPRFIEKIIQQEIKVPAISNEKTDLVYKKCLENLLASYGVSVNEMKVYSPVIKYIVAKNKDMRMFKRMINSVFAIVFCEDTLLYKVDLLAIEAIHFYEPDLYKIIYDNREFFISHERGFDFLSIHVNKDKFNFEGKKFLDSLFETYVNEKELLASVFPYVERYTANGILEYDYIVPDPKNAEVLRLSRACDGKYFDLYFSYGSNSYIRMRKKAEQLISQLNICRDLEMVEKILFSTFSNIPYYQHKELVEHLQYHIGDVDKHKSWMIATGLLSQINIVSHIGDFFGLDPKTRVQYIISMLLLMCSNEEYVLFLDATKNDYSKLNVMLGIHHWLDSDKDEHYEERKKLAEQMFLIYSSMCEKVIDEQIDLYENIHYEIDNVWGLYHYFKLIGKEDDFPKYIADTISLKNIYRILWDVTKLSISSCYMYSINESDFNVIFKNRQIVDEAIEKNPPKTDDEFLVYKIYDLYKNGETDEWERKKFTSDNPIFLEL